MERPNKNNYIRDRLPNFHAYTYDLEKYTDYLESELLKEREEKEKYKNIFGLCKLSNKELIQKVDEMTDKIYDPSNKGYIPSHLYRSIPAKPNEDYDLLIGELLLRFNELTKQFLNDTKTKS